MVWDITHNVKIQSSDLWLPQQRNGHGAGLHERLRPLPLKLCLSHSFGM